MCAFMPAIANCSARMPGSSLRANSGAHALETHASAAAASKAWK